MKYHTLSTLRDLFQATVDANGAEERKLIYGQACWLYQTGAISWEASGVVSLLWMYCDRLDRRTTHREFMEVIVEARSDKLLGLAWTWLETGRYLKRRMELFSRTSVGEAWQRLSKLTPAQIMDSMGDKREIHFS